MGRIVHVEQRPRLTGSLVAGDVVVGADAATVAGGGVALASIAVLDGDGVVVLPETGGIAFVDGLAQDADMSIRAGTGSPGLRIANDDGELTLVGSDSVLVQSGTIATVFAPIVTLDGLCTIDGSGASQGVSILGGVVGIAMNGAVAITGTLSATNAISTGDPATTRSNLGIGAPLHYYKTGTQNFTSAADVTFGTGVLTTADVTKTGDEYIVNTAGTYEILVTARHLSGGGVAGDTVLDLWLTDDVTSQGTDVEIPGSRVGATVTTSPEAASLATHALVPGLVSGDTLRVVAQRTSGTDTAGISHARITIRRVA